jgi:hypothetical protein
MSCDEKRLLQLANQTLVLLKKKIHLFVVMRKKNKIKECLLCCAQILMHEIQAGCSIIHLKISCFESTLNQLSISKKKDALQILIKFCFAYFCFLHCGKICFCPFNSNKQFDKLCSIFFQILLEIVSPFFVISLIFPSEPRKKNISSFISKLLLFVLFNKLEQCIICIFCQMVNGIRNSDC